MRISEKIMVIFNKLITYVWIIKFAHIFINKIIQKQKIEI